MNLMQAATSQQVVGPTWERRKLSVSQAFATAFILATYTGVLTYIVVIYAHAFTGGFILGFKIAGGAWGIIFGSSFFAYSIFGRRIRMEVPVEQGLAFLRQTLAPMEAKVKDDITTGNRNWNVNTHISDRGLGVGIDLHDMELENAKAAMQICISVRHKVGRMTFISGRGDATSRMPRLRTLILSMLSQPEIIRDFHLWKKRSTITLRPRRPPLPRREMILKMTALGAPLAGMGALGFMDLAQANTLSGTVGAAAGLFLTWLLITHSR